MTLFKTPCLPFFFFFSPSSFILVVESLPSFRDRIPNGHAVPNPLIPGTIWSGVGHDAVGGGGPRNPFGRDFASAEIGNFTWTLALCQRDSDGDGRTNGQELGDPDCTWQEGDTPALPAASHPGVVDQPIATPLDSTDTCAEYDPPADTEMLDVTFTAPNTLDGSQRTEYVCEQFRVAAPNQMGSATDYYHQIKQEPILDNADVLHHIWIYSCQGTPSSDGDRVGQGAYSCNGIEANCVIVAGWALGMEPTCEPPHVGAGVAFNAWAGNTAVFKVEAHYDNAQLQPATDQSGMRMHLTRQLRALEAGMVIVGMDYYDRQFTLPAGQTSVARRNICPTEATMRGLQDRPIYIYSWNPHMHLYGRSLVTEHYRCGVKIGEIGNIPQFEFDNQQSYVLDQPVKVLPGDALVTTCSYDTSETTNPVVGGEETTDEMCDNYLAYYPSVWTEQEPTLFTACTAFEQGLNPDYVNYDDTASFVTLDLIGNFDVTGHDPDPANNLAPCCSNGGAVHCEQLYLAKEGEACGVDADCKDDLVCRGALCQVDSSNSGGSEQNNDKDGDGGTTDQGSTASPVAAPSSSAVDHSINIYATAALLSIGYFAVAP